MKIIIDYESSWRNSFLDGSNNEPLPKKGRNFIASMTNLKDAKNFIKREITHDTVMGILNRLIGDQRKLYQARSQTPYYFYDLEPLITFKDKIDLTRTNDNEVIYIRNMLGNTDQNSFSGVIKSDDLAFSADYSAEFWGVLAMNLAELVTFIVEDKDALKPIELNPLTICDKFESFKKIKPDNMDYSAVLTVLKNEFPDQVYTTAKGDIIPSQLYCAALYLKQQKLKKKYPEQDFSAIQGTRGGLIGISKRNFTKSDFMKRFTSGNGKLIFGNPYIRKERVKGVGEVSYFMTKASGQLEIDIDIDKDRAVKLTELIDDAGVSSFYLGKKGLAYVSKIDTRPRNN
jgi:hypothetical protein